MRRLRNSAARGTVAIRLLRGRKLLRNRLIQRGLLAGASGFMLNAGLPHVFAAAVPPTLATATATAAMAFASGTALAEVVPAGVAALLDAAGHEFWRNKCKGLAIVLAALGLTGSGANVAAHIQEHIRNPVSTPAVAASVPRGPSAIVPMAPPDDPQGAMVLKDKENRMKWVLNPATMPPTNPQAK